MNVLSNVALLFLKGNTMLPSIKMLEYIADYVNEELSRGTVITKYILMEAVMAFDGGAADMEETQYH
jgi:hypothetical protein